MLSEYNFDYSRAKPNRFAGRISKERLVVLLDPEVSQIFTTPESVNNDPYGDGWMVKMTVNEPADVDTLMDAAAYEAITG